MVPRAILLIWVVEFGKLLYFILSIDYFRVGFHKKGSK